MIYIKLFEKYRFRIIMCEVFNNKKSLLIHYLKMNNYKVFCIFQAMQVGM